MMRRDAFAAVTLSATIFAGLCGMAYSQAPAGLPALPGQQATPAPQGQGNVPTAVPPAAPGAPPVPGVPAPAVPGATPVAPGAGPAIPGVPAPGALPGLPALPGAATTSFGATAVAVPTPPPLGSMNLESTDEAISETTATIADAAAPSQLYTFLFIDDPKYGVVRQKFLTDVAENLKEQEIQRLITARRAGQQPGALGLDIAGVTPGYVPGGFGEAALYGPPGAGVGPAGFGPGAGVGAYGMEPYGAEGYGAAAPYGAAGLAGVGAAGVAGNESAIRAAAEWDFYYSQLEMYDRFIREKVIPGADELPVLEYTATNALQERQDLFESFQTAAIEQSNEDYNANKEFYERLQRREDRRRAYVDWLLLQQREVAEWSEVWARQIFGDRWADGENVNVDDWYYGTDFNSARPVLVAIDDREYIVSRNPVGRLADGQLNVISTNLTPYDIIDTNGYLRNPVMSTLRGTLVIPPAAPVYTTGATTGTIEIIGGLD